MKSLVKKMLRHTEMTEKEIQEYLGVSDKEFTSYLSALKREGVIEQRGLVWRLRC